MPPRTRASSSRPSAQDKGKGKVTAEQNEWDTEVAAWMSALKNRDFVVETSVDHQIDSMYEITQSFRNIGWDSILQFKGIFYLELVREFYANISNKHRRSSKITSTVRGKRIIVSPAILRHEFQIPNDGDILTITERTDESGIKLQECNVNSAWSLDEATTRLDVSVHHTGRKDIYYLKHFEIQDRLLAYVLAHNMDPKSSDSHLARLTDIYHIESMRYGQPATARVALAATVGLCPKDQSLDD